MRRLTCSAICSHTLVTVPCEAARTRLEWARSTRNSRASAVHTKCSFCEREDEEEEEGGGEEGGEEKEEEEEEKRMVAGRRGERWSVAEGRRR